MIQPGLWHIGCDIRHFAFPNEAYAVCAAPPCCCFCRPGARWWPKMDANGRTDEAIGLFKSCLRLCRRATGWWALENPPGRHQRLIPELGKPAWQYQPWEYGDNWGKQTYIWGNATKPPVSPLAARPPSITYRTPNGHTQGRIARMSSKREREKTPAGFSKAFFEANQ